MGRIVTSVSIQNVANPSSSIRCDALVDTGAGYMVLPAAWKNRLDLGEPIRTVELELGDQSSASGEVCGPVRLELEGFSPIFTEVLFIDMCENDDGGYEPLVGYIPLEQAGLAVDMLGHRLVRLKRADLKRAAASDSDPR